jgi:hypothetical protein
VEKDDEGTVKKNEMTDMEAFKKTAEFKRVYHIRHKLQKLVYGKEPVSKSCMLMSIDITI